MSQSPKTVILSAPQGYGKSALAADLARQHGCSGIVDEYSPGMPLKGGHLHLTNVSPQQLADCGAEVVSMGWGAAESKEVANG